ncbi:MAG TPA: hypothetical protein VFK42_04495 [Acidimicrobiales bacterium]|nr:hypothetical protein [Acidimicrobiales bacterium]
MKKAFPIALMIVGLVFLAAGGYTIKRGWDAKDQVKSELVAQNIVTPDDARVPGVQVNSASSAKVMADIINHHALEATGGLTYSEMGRFANKEGTPKGTDDAKAAVLDATGKPVANNLRNTALTAANLRTSLYSSIMAFNVADLVMGLGLMIIVLGFATAGLGVALGALSIPRLGYKLHVEPLVAEHTV